MVIIILSSNDNTVRYETAIVPSTFTLAHNWAVHMHSPNMVPRTDFEGHTTSGVNNL